MFGSEFPFIILIVVIIIVITKFFVHVDFWPLFVNYLICLSSEEIFKAATFSHFAIGHSLNLVIICNTYHGGNYFLYLSVSHLPICLLTLDVTIFLDLLVVLNNSLFIDLVDILGAWEYKQEVGDYVLLLLLCQPLALAVLEEHDHHCNDYHALGHDTKVTDYY